MRASMLLDGNGRLFPVKDAGYGEMSSMDSTRTACEALESEEVYGNSK